MCRPCRSARALLDAAPVVPAKRLRVAIDDARSRNLLTDERLRRRAQDLGRHRGAVIVRRLFAVGALAQRSEGERLFASVLAGLRPRPLYNVEILPGIRVDALDVEPALVMEYDGREDHSLPAAIDADHQRQFLIQDAGYEVRRISYSMVSTPAARERTLAGIRRARERRLALLGAGRVDLPSALP
ncbi:MAG: hypothetical protein M3N52_10830 [Actinomycetota bacterium]|nr:hypothetical protein [Actinomycetota bacterium]